MKTSQKKKKQKIAVVPFLPLKSMFHIILGFHHLQKLQIPKIWSKYCTFHKAEWYHLWQTKAKTKLWKEACDWEGEPPLPALTWKQKHLSPTLSVAGLFQDIKVILPLTLLSLCQLLNFIKTVDADEEVSKPKSLLLFSRWGKGALIPSR